MRRPREAAIGVSADGTFKTASLKEYPPRLCEGLARALANHLRDELRAGHYRYVPAWAANERSDNYLKEWVAGAAEASACIRENAIWLPDHQPRQL